MRRLTAVLVLAICVGLSSMSLAQQQQPSIGYLFPSGGQAGSTVEVVLGGYDWTPDMEIFVRQPAVGLELTGAPGPVIVPEPPYWFGKKARRSPFPMPRETAARLSIPPHLPPGIYKWQAANANGVAPAGRFIVSGPEEGLEVVEERGRREPQQIPQLPAIVSGQILRIEEVDRYRFTASRTGPVTCISTAAAIGSPLTAVLEVRDAGGRLIADAADTEARDLGLTFAATAGGEYVVSIYDLDFRGDRSFVYRLAIVPGPRVVAALPAVGRRGETREVEFVGYGVATGGDQLESVKRPVTFPGDPALSSFAFRLDTPFGRAPVFQLSLSDSQGILEPAETETAVPHLAVPASVTGVLDRRAEPDSYRVSGKQGEVWAITAAAAAIASPLDLSVVVLDAQGKELKRVDDTAGTTDALFEFTVPADGDYQMVVGDTSGHGGSRASVYHLTIQTAEPGFRLSAPEQAGLLAGGKAQLAVTAARSGGFKGPIVLRLEGLPPGVTVPDALTIAEGKNDLKIDLTAAADAGTGASFVTMTGTATIGEREETAAPEGVLLAVTMKPPFSIDAEGKDDVTKWPRGTTFPGPVLIEREAGFDGPIVLEMHSMQGRHIQGISGPELMVPPGVSRVLYPIYLPEWLETTRTSRMVVNGVAQVTDPKGRVRYLSSKLKTRIGFLPGGALLSLECDVPEIEVAAGEPFEIPLTLSRALELKEPAVLELRLADDVQGQLQAEPLRIESGESQMVLKVIPSAGLPAGEHELLVRATVLQAGSLPVIAEARVLVAFIESAGGK